MINPPLYFNCIKAAAEAEFRDRGSRFIAYCFPMTEVKEFKEALAKQKKQHPKAAHHCFAYRIGTDGNNFRSSDDGEPSGTAGRPILGQIDSLQVVNSAVIVVRYFGGTLLGVPGLINAYKTVTAAALQTATIVKKPILKNYRIQFNYTQLNDVMKITRQHAAEINRQEAHLFSIMELGVPLETASSFEKKLREMQGVECEII